jgi:predicted ester cyclase
MAASKSVSGKAAARKASKTRKSRTAGKKAAKTRKSRAAARKAAGTPKRRAAAKKALATRKTKAPAAARATTAASVDTLLHRWFEEVWNQGLEAAIDDMLAADCIVHGLLDESLHGPEAFKAFHRGLYPEFSTLKITLQEVTLTDDGISADCLVEGTHRATGKPVRFTGHARIRVSDGRIAEGWNDFDFDTMNAQISA